MIDVHLIGYTADLEHLVLDLDGEANGRYRLVVDADLLATLGEMHERTVEEGRGWPGDELVDGDDDWAGEDTEDWDDEHDEPVHPVDADAEEDAEDEDAGGDDEATAEVVPGPGPEPAPAPRPPDPAPDPAPRTERAATRREEAPPPPAVAAPASEPERREAKLSPAEIQGLLRAGRSAKSVAKAAGTDVSWIERWLAPILEERARILREAHAGKLERPRLGTSRSPLGEAVQRSLAERKVDPEEVSWETSRRADGRWKVSVKYRHRNRSRTASWAYDPRDGALEPSSDLARELGFRAPRAKRSQAKPKAQAKPETKPKTQSKPRPKAQSGAKAEPDRGAEAESG